MILNHASLSFGLMAACVFVAMTGCNSAAPESTDASPESSTVNSAPAASIPESVPATESTAAIYLFGEYDESRDPNADLTTSLSRAKAENKRVMLQVGGDWCEWCQRIANFMSTNNEIRKLVTSHFVVMKVAQSGEFAEDFLSNYPKINAYPHLFVLNADGELIHSQDTEELEDGEGYDPAKFADFLNRCKP